MNCCIVQFVQGYHVPSDMRLLPTFADAYQVTDGTGATRAECMNEQEKDMHFHRVSGSGQMSSGQWRLGLTLLTRMAGSMLWIFQGLGLLVFRNVSHLPPLV